MRSSKQSQVDSQEEWRSDPEVLTDVLRKAMKEAVREAIEDHHRAGNPVAIWRDGQVVLWYPDGSFRPVT